MTKRLMFLCAVCVLLGGFGACDYLRAGLSAAERWEGVYRVEGKNPEGSTYTGAVQIDKVDGTALYTLTWALDVIVDPCAPGMVPNGEGECVYMQAVGYVHGDLLIVTGVNMRLLGSFKRDGGLWLIPNLKSPLPEKWTRTEATQLLDAVKPVRRPANHPPTIPGPGVTARPTLEVE